MCCLFGLLDYTGHFTGKQKSKIVSILSVACEERGTDATGISYNHNEHLTVFKRPLTAHKMRFAIPNVPLIMGHTRMTTQGDEKRNYNNHPFYGKADNTEFTLAHNGVLHNDTALRKSEKLPATKIETDSYVAVQIIEKKRELGFESLKYMAEKLLGSFTITVMDKDDNLYFVKGDNPMCIYHYPEIGVYIYASTEDILKKALKKMPYRFGKGCKVELVCGDILKINRYGRIASSQSLIRNCLILTITIPIHHCEELHYPLTKRKTMSIFSSSKLMRVITAIQRILLICSLTRDVPPMILKICSIVVCSDVPIGCTCMIYL